MFKNITFSSMNSSHRLSTAVLALKIVLLKKIPAIDYLHYLILQFIYIKYLIHFSLKITVIFNCAILTRQVFYCADFFPFLKNAKMYSVFHLKTVTFAYNSKSRCPIICLFPPPVFYIKMLQKFQFYKTSTAKVVQTTLNTMYTKKRS